MTFPDEPEITAVIPTWNRAHLVGHAIESVLAQTRPPGSVIVVDDGSTDDTEAVVSLFGAVVRYVKKANGGVSSARNRGVRESSSPWIAFLDSDDAWDRDHLARMTDAIHATGGRADLYFSDTRLGAAADAPTMWRLGGFNPTRPHHFAADGADWALLDIQPMMLQASVIRRTAYDEVGGLWETLRTREDTHLFCKLAINRPVCAVSGVGAVMDAADPTMRLTTMLGATTEFYWRCSVLMWQELLSRFPGLDGKHRRTLRLRTGTSFLRLARFAAGQHAWGRFLSASTQAVLLNPAGVGRAIRRRMARGSERAAQPAVGSMPEAGADSAEAAR